MDKIIGNAYRGDPGVPHADSDRFWNIWIGSAAFSVLTWVNPYMWQLSNQFKEGPFLFGLVSSLGPFCNMTRRYIILLSWISHIGMTEQCCLSNITGRKHVRRTSPINLSGMRRAKPFVTRTILTGLFTSLSILPPALWVLTPVLLRHV
ncbi:hypothetical protein OROGR_024087 [Orobanche gracilis]